MAGLPVRFTDGGALEGAQQNERETMFWAPSARSADAIINPLKEMADARGRDSERNDGFIHGAIALAKDNVVGAQFRLITQPNLDYLSTLSAGFNASWMEKFQLQVEARFRLMAESNRNWLDAAGRNTFTGMIRLAAGVFSITGEYLGTVEWLNNDASRPINTAIQTVNPDRLCNPNEEADSRTLRRGVEIDFRGAPQAYHFRRGDRYEPFMDGLSFEWKRVEARKPWGRTQVIHIVEQNSADQTRGISDMVSALKTMHMFKKFSEVTLQSAVINATYAAAITSDLPPEAIATALGSTNGDPATNLMNLYRMHMGALGAFMGDANNVRVDGAMIPHLFPNTKLSMTPVKTAGGIGTGFEESLLRHIAAPLGLSYEALTRDFSKTNYSSGRAALGVQAQFMASRKKHVADRLGDEIFALVLEEELANGNVPLPRGITRDIFYADNGLVKEALTQCKWIGSGAGQIDEVRETEAAMMRVRAGFSTHAIEAARLGLDSRELFAQMEREQKDAKERGLVFDLSNSGAPPPDPNAEDGSATPPARKSADRGATP